VTTYNKWMLRWPLAAALLLAIAASAHAQDWPKRPITIVVPFDVGGSVDRLARGLANFLPKQLGVPVTVVDRPGAGGQVGTTGFRNQPDDGDTLMVTPATPYLAVNMLVTHARYTLDDFAFVNAQWSDYTVLAVPKDRPYRTAAELVEAIKNQPGKISVSVTFGSVGQVTTMALLDALHLPANAVRSVTFDGGGATRTALAGGQVDFSIEQGEGAETILDLIRPLAVFLDHRVSMFDAPPINEALQSFGVTVPLLSGSIRTFVAPAGFKAKHPKDFATLVEAYRKTLETPEFRDWLAANRMGADWTGPERATELVRSNVETLRKYQHLLKE
jgi:putative tricarboxylic transport membrane protein